MHAMKKSLYRLLDNKFAGINFFPVSFAFFQTDFFVDSGFQFRARVSTLIFDHRFFGIK